MNRRERQQIVDAVLDRLDPSSRLRHIKDTVLGVTEQADTFDAKTVRVAPNVDGAVFRVRGIRCFNGPFEVIVDDVRHRGEPKIAGPVDAAAYVVDAIVMGERLAEDDVDPRGFHRARWGDLTKDEPLALTFRALGCPSFPPYLGLALYGELWVEKAEELDPEHRAWVEAITAAIDDATGRTEKAAHAVEGPSWGIPRR